MVSLPILAGQLEERRESTHRQFADTSKPHGKLNSFFIGMLRLLQNANNFGKKKKLRARTYTVPPGSAVLLGAPAKPMPATRRNDICNIVHGISGVREAYLPQCYISGGMESPAQVLVLVLDGNADQERIMGEVERGLARVLPAETRLDVWPMERRNRFLETIRNSCTDLSSSAAAKKRRWWSILR